MLKLTKKADYGLIALKHLVMFAPESSSAKEIAHLYGIPQPLLSKILQKLAKNGFLRSEHGTNGGYKLARDPRQITALEVIRLIDGFYRARLLLPHR
jgi:Rrf2 family protein